MSMMCGIMCVIMMSVIMLRANKLTVDMLSDIMLTVAMMGDIMLILVKLTVIILIAWMYSLAVCHHAQCHCAGCRYA